jgi:hypothetical protein
MYKINKNTKSLRGWKYILNQSFREVRIGL